MKEVVLRIPFGILNLCELTEEDKKIIAEALGFVKRAVQEEIDSPMVGNINEIGYYISIFAQNHGFKCPARALSYLQKLNEIYPSAASSVILRTIAVEFDKKYLGHIEDSEHIFVISTINGKIIEADKSKIKNYKNFSAFRSIKDAKDACYLMSQFKAILKDYNAESK